jgi:ABC-type transport system substrate-binding protein
VFAGGLFVDSSLNQQAVSARQLPAAECRPDWNVASESDGVTGWRSHWLAGSRCDGGPTIGRPTVARRHVHRPATRCWTAPRCAATRDRLAGPAIDFDVYSWPWERLVFETLITYDAGTTLVPRLATAMPEVSADGLTYTFTLRDGVSFVNADGSVLRTVEAADFVYSLNRLLNPNLTPSPSPVSTSFFSRIEGAAAVTDGTATEASGLVAVDARTLRITLTEPDPTFLNVLAMPFGSVVPHESAGTDTAMFSQHPVGTGPYLLAEWQPGVRARFVRNPHYWNDAVGLSSEINLGLGVEPDTQLQQVQTGNLDVMTDPIPAGQYNATVSDPRWADYVHRAPQVVVNYLAMDTHADGPTGNVMVRQAIARAIDRENVVRIRNGRAEPGTCIYPPLLVGYDPTCNPYPYDVDAAKALLDQTEWAHGFSTDLLSLDAEPDRSIAQAIQQDLAEIGIDVSLDLQPDETFFTAIYNSDVKPLTYTGWVMDFPDPADFIDTELSCASDDGGYNAANYCNPAIDELSDQARAENDVAARLQLFGQIQEEIMADAPWAPTDYPEKVAFARPQVSGFAIHPVWGFDFEKFSIAN